MQSTLKEDLIQKAISLFPNPEQLDAELENFETDPLIDVFPDELRLIQLINKLVIGDYFGLRMLLKRLKFKAADNDKALPLFSLIEACQRECHFSKLLQLVGDLKQSFQVWEALVSKLVPNTERHVLGRLASLYVNCDLNELSKLVNKNIKEAQELVLLHGYKIHENWVKFETVSQKRTTAYEKDLLRNKQLELTELTTILSTFK